jgi:nucleoid DNA-binding protein
MRRNIKMRRLHKHRHPGTYKVRTRKGRIIHKRKPLHNLTLSKHELISRVAAKYEAVPKNEVAGIIDESNSVIVDELKKGHTVRVNGLGIFRVKHKPARPAHIGRNPGTGEAVKVPAKPASKVIRFRASKDVKV